MEYDPDVPQYVSEELLEQHLVTIGDRQYYDVYGEYYDTAQKFMYWGGHIIPVGGQYTTEILIEIKNRITRGESNIFFVTGPPGSGKSWFALALARFFDPKFKVIEPAPDATEDPSQVVYEREHLLYLIGENSPLRRGQVIIIDEPQFSADARRWFQSIQQDFVNQIESVRFRGFVIIFVCLHTKMIDNRIRQHLASYQLHMIDKGVAVVYNIFLPRFEDNLRYYRKGPLDLGLVEEDICPHPDCLECNFAYGTNRRNRKGENPDKNLCKGIRAKYERRKATFIAKMNEIAKRKAEDETRRKEIETYRDTDYVEKLYENRDKLEKTQKGTITIASIILTLKEVMGVSLGRSKATLIRDMLQYKHPELLNKHDKTKNQ